MAELVPVWGRWFRDAVTALGLIVLLSVCTVPALIIPATGC